MGINGKNSPVINKEPRRHTNFSFGHLLKPSFGAFLCLLSLSLHLTKHLFLPSYLNMSQRGEGVVEYPATIIFNILLIHLLKLHFEKLQNKIFEK